MFNQINVLRDYSELRLGDYCLVPIEEKLRFGTISQVPRTPLIHYRFRTEVGAESADVINYNEAIFLRHSKGGGLTAFIGDSHMGRQIVFGLGRRG